MKRPKNTTKMGFEKAKPRERTSVTSGEKLELVTNEKNLEKE